MPDHPLPPDLAPHPPNQALLSQLFQQLLLGTQLNFPVQNNLLMLPFPGLTFPTLPVNNLPDFNTPTPQDVKDETIAQQCHLINMQQEEIKFLKARETRLKSKKSSQAEDNFWKQQMHFMNREAYHNTIRQGWMREKNRLLGKVSRMDEEVSKLKLENETLKVKNIPPEGKTIEEFALETEVKRLKRTVETHKKRSQIQSRPLFCNPFTLLSNTGQVDKMVQQTLARRAILTPQELIVEKIKLDQFVENVGKYYEAVNTQPPVITIDDEDDVVEDDGPEPKKRRCEKLEVLKTESTDLPTSSDSAV